MDTTETVQSGGDDLRSVIEQDYDKLTQEPEVVEQPKEVAEPTDKTRDEKGRFAKREAEPVTQEEPKAPEVTEQELKPEQPTDKAIPAPVHWKGSAKVRWEKLPVRVQEEIARDLEEAAKKSQGIAPLEQVLAPHKQKLSMRYGDEVRGVQTLLAYADALEKDPVGTLQYIARERGVDLTHLVPMQQGGDPNLQAYQQEIHQLKQQLAQINQRFESGNTQSLQAQIDAFARDPAHPYFNDVRVEMGALIQAAEARGQAITMKQAYEQAVYANPVIRSELLQAEQEKVTAAKQQKLAEAKAAQPIKGAPGTGGSVNGTPPATLRGTIEEAWNALS